MLFAPVCIGDHPLEKEALAEDHRNMKKIGPCGAGKKALYLNSFFIDRRFYVPYSDISRIFKRVAMSKGGFSGKGVFGSIPYLVVQLRSGREQQCNFKYEEEVDQILRTVGRSHPEIPTVSAKAEKRMEEARRKEEARYLKDLSPEAGAAVDRLEKARAYLEKEPAYSDSLSYAARQKRVIDSTHPMYRYAALAIFLLSAGALVFGLISLYRRQGFAIYFVLFGMAFMFYVMASRMLPTGRNNKAFGQKQWEEALSRMKAYTDRAEDFPLPCQYAHPATCTRVIRVLREGRARTLAEAWQVMKTDLKALNRDVTVSPAEYEEVVAIKPMFIICDYQDTIGSEERQRS